MENDNQCADDLGFAGSNLVEMAALGRLFQIGTLFNCQTDTIIPETLLWDPAKVMELAGCRYVTENKYSSFMSGLASEDKWAQIGMDDHLIVSWMSGLIGPFCLGAADYIENQWLSDSLNCSLHIRTVNRQEKLDHELTKGRLEIVCNPAILKRGRASHVVTAISYGLHTYCVFELEQDDISDLEREDALELLQRAANQFQDGLEDADQQINSPDYENVIVLMFADWNTTKQPLRLPYIEAFQRCKVELSTFLFEKNSPGIPLTVWLRPVNQIVSVSLINEYQLIGSEIINQSLDLFTQIVRIQLTTKRLIQHSSRWDQDDLNTFDLLLSEFRKRFQNRMAESVRNFRTRNMDGHESNFSSIVAIVNASVFKPELLNHWIERQKLWINLADFMKKTLPDVPIYKDVRNADIGNDSEPVLILQIPRPIPVCDSLLKQMDNYIHHNVKLFRCLSSYHFDPETFPSLDALCASFRSVSRLAHFISVNRPSKVKYMVVVHGKSYPKFRLYCNESMEDYEIPSSPSDLRIVGNHRGKLTLAWNMNGLVNVTDFLVEYRRFCDLSSSWTSIKAGVVEQIQLSLTPREQYVFHVATETLAGRSEFSCPLGPESISSVCDPPGGIICTLATDDVIKIRWADPRQLDQGVVITSYEVEFWPDSDQSHHQKLLTTEKQLKLENLKNGTTYQIRVAAVCGTEGTSAFSSPVRVTTLLEEERVASIVKEVSTLADNSPDPSSGTAIYNIPLRSVDDGGISRRMFGSPNLSFQHKTVLVVGESGAGKTTLINAMVNYILGVKWEDDFRLQLIQETDLTQAHSQTNSIMAYDLFRSRGSRLDYSLTIVDTPGFGDTRGLAQDNFIMDQIRQYFEDEGGIQQLEAVCFVIKASSSRLSATQLYIFDKILSIFGNDIGGNIRLMITFADNNVPPAMAAIEEAKIPCSLDLSGCPSHHKFNSSSFFAQKGDAST